MQQRSLAQVVIPILGAVYVVLGLVGFGVTGFEGFTQDGPDELLGGGLNPFHNIVHIGAGLFLIIMGLQKNPAAAEGAAMGAGLSLIVFFIVGVTRDDNLTILSTNGVGDFNNFNHLVVGVTLLVVGLLSSGATSAQMRKRGLA
ncbi:MAG TPA: DUF4383 domain-containing protein [Solirubrobacteraceae bacterium]|nr:DUF4383 domain-containing protein [Solirubrobacteraceae bacterium]